ncbi:transcriptional regulator, AraC family [Mucilaginibacter pineti]|uniref:Transcriptional regulator, AraC family n=1 Tax=Mucilaginibacter pineti TaxID=1391627 RepID=A0A1G7EWZ9_9SPHI|nr:AraC family transcriptional regulator [Mucilaginibacter pineti]SDE68172.1 transcriptional regulator, AraC family [Mucilaginibacter pineti]
MKDNSKRRDGFVGEKLISIPQKVIKTAKTTYPALLQNYVTHIGYFPKASFHYRERRKGCEDNILIYCLQGKGNFIVDQTHFEIKSNQFIMVPATDKYMRYWADRTDPWTIYWIHFTGENIAEFNKSLKLSISKGPVQVPFNEKAIAVWQNIYETFEMGYSNENMINASFLIYPLLSSFLFYKNNMESGEQSHSRNIISETIAYMRQHINEKLTVENLANLNLLSASYFSKFFSNAVGMPPIDYFIHLKMQRACYLIKTENTKIKIVARELGYEDQFYFSRLFKSHIGISPNEYRLSTKNDDFKLN